MGETVPGRLRADLKVALANRDRLEMSQIRTLIGAIENAEAVDVEHSTEFKLGLGHDVPRRTLDSEDIARIITRERDELLDAISRYRDLGLDDELAELQTRLQIVERYLA